MATITILGAGYMGSALAVVAAGSGHEVRLWGTWLDDELVDPVLDGDPHPRLKMPLPDTIQVHPSPQLDQALQGADAVVCAVNSDGVIPVLSRAVEHLPEEGPLLSVTKGFLPDAQGRIQRISTVVRRQLLQPAGKDRPWVHIGGPCKAMEVAREIPTAVLYAAEEPETCERCARWLERDFYTITRTDDLAGVETCSAFKNAYATASGLCDGLQLIGHPEMYNTKAMVFSRAIAEISRMVQAMGGRPGTAGGLAGVGDLHVTAAAGRNRTYGEHVGRGEPPDRVAERMRATGELTEGYPALQTGWDLLNQLASRGELDLDDFPLLATLHRIVYQGADVASSLAALRIRD
jgi:glycerol-3-phosphate dehydrogenase (NAD(P)+)